MMRIMIYVFLLSVVITGCNAQQQEKSTYDSVVLKNYDLVNEAGITNFKYALYPPNSIIRAAEYSKLSEVNNESIEALITSLLSETSMEWYRYNRDYQGSSDSLRKYEEKYEEWTTNKMTYELLSKYTYEYDGQLFARAVARKNSMNGTSDKLPSISTLAMICIQGHWYITRSQPEYLKRLAIASYFIEPISVYNILNIQPTNDGERLLLKQSLNEDGVLDFYNLTEALYSVRVQRKENTAIQSLIMEPHRFSKAQEKEIRTNEPAKVQERENWKNEPPKIKYSKSREKEVWGKRLEENSLELFYGTPVYEAAKAIKDKDMEALENWAASASDDLLDYQEQKYKSSLNLFAISLHDIASLKILTEAGADPNISNKWGISAFLLSCADFHGWDSSLMKYLLENGGDPNSESSGSRYRTPLILTSRTNLDNVKLLVEAGADYNYFKRWEDAFNKNDSPLHSAAKSKKIHIVNYYIFEKGVDYKTLNKPSKKEGIPPSTILSELRLMCFSIGSEEYIAKWKLIDYLKKKAWIISKNLYLIM